MLTLLALLPACDTHTLNFKDTGDDLTCGPGTHEENGQCVADEADTDTDTDADTDTDTDADTDTSNAAPGAPVVAITPDNATQLSDLTCTVVTPAVDPDGDPITYAYAWSVHGVESAITDAVVPESATVAGDTWTCRVTASDGVLDGPAAEASVTLTQGYSEVAVGTYHACGLIPHNVGEPGDVACWGGNAYGEGTPAAGTFAHIFAGYYETCAADATGALTCWGTPSWGMDTPPEGSFVAYDLGWYGAYAVAGDGALSKWGYASTLPAGTFTQVAGGEYDYCALDTDGLIQCWGVNPNGEGDAPAGEFTALSGGYHNFCALDTDGYPSCWGLRDEVNDAPREVLAALSAYDGNACGLRTDSSLLCWGDDAALVADAPAGAFTQVSVGGGAACAVDTAGRATCWGSGASAPPSR